uniref:Ubiquitin-like domain-containing protein n=1 Tax=viral metagenome TaxID=1070528 RepID=A0A6C0B9M5_9ZZZZ
MSLRVPGAFAVSEDPEKNKTISFVVANDDAIEPTTHRMSENTTLGQIVSFMNETYGIEVEFVIYRGAEIYPSNPYGTKIDTIVNNDSGTLFFVKEMNNGRVRSGTPRSGSPRTLSTRSGTPKSGRTPLMFDMSPFSDRSSSSSFEPPQKVWASKVLRRKDSDRSDSSSSYEPPQKLWASNVLRRNNSNSSSSPRSPFFPPLKRGEPVHTRAFGGPSRRMAKKYSKRRTNKRRTSKRRTNNKKTSKRKTSKRRSK